MPAEPPQPPTDTTGTIRIVRQTRAGDLSRPFDFLVSFGGAFGIEDLIRLLPKVGVSQSEIDTALEMLKAHSHHEFPNVSLTKRFLRSLGS